MISREDAVVMSILDLAASLVEEGWCQNAWACNADGADRVETDSDATAWCLAGAIRRAGYDLCASRLLTDRALTYVWKVNGASVPNSEWNDMPGRKAAEVVALLKRAAQEIDAVWGHEGRGEGS